MPTFIKTGGVWRNTTTTDAVIPPTTVIPPSSPCQYSIDTVTFSRNAFSQIVICDFRPRLILPLPLNDTYVSFYNFNPDETIAGGESYNTSCQITVLDNGYRVAWEGSFAGNLTSFSRRYIAFK